MSKELEAFNVIKNELYDIEAYKKPLNVIETALIAKEKYKVLSQEVIKCLMNVTNEQILLEKLVEEKDYFLNLLIKKKIDISLLVDIIEDNGGHGEYIQWCSDESELTNYEFDRLEKLIKDIMSKGDKEHGAR